MSTCLALGYEVATSGIFFTAVAAGLVFRTYRAEYVFGLVLGMLVVFGGVLPVLVGWAVAALSAFAHFVLWPARAWIWRAVHGGRAR